MFAFRHWKAKHLSSDLEHKVLSQGSRTRRQKAGLNLSACPNLKVTLMRMRAWEEGFGVGKGLAIVEQNFGMFQEYAWLLPHAGIFRCSFLG